MTPRTIMAVVADMRRHGLPVELQILMDELVVIAAGLQADRDRAEERRAKWRTAKHVLRTSSEVLGSPRTPPHPPRGNINNKKITPPKPPLAEPLFDEFWEVYPLKVGKGAARKAFRHANARASAADIIAGARAYAAKKTEPKFTKHPSTWLNADCWLDEEPKSNVVSGSFRRELPPVPEAELTPEERERRLAALDAIQKAKRAMKA